MSHRVIQDLASVQRLKERPRSLPKVRRVRGTKYLGLKYERDVAAALRNAGHTIVTGQWFRYIDANGPGYCQTDILVRLADNRVAILECKLSNVEEALEKLCDLYIPVVQHITKRQVLAFPVLRHVSRCDARIAICETFAEACRTRSGVLHWRGGPI